ncbi:MAG: ABC transporter ATP-binding protein [Bdellovibrionales bacterium]|nr:ABC transporter ATP-binding protein [Bdellovibrionales bacterium]
MIGSIALRDVTRTYHQGDETILALNHATLTLAPGEFTTFFGPSGSGKSTALNIIGGLDTPTSGEVLVGDHVLSSMTRSERADFRLRHIGFVFQAYNLIPVLTAQENVEFIMELQGISVDIRRDRAGEVLQQVGLAGMEKRRPGELSGGQQQRVAVARAIASNPELILADEPTANLDSASSEALIELMLELNETYKSTFIFSTHDPLVMKSAHRLIELKDGQIISDTTQGEA